MHGLIVKITAVEGKRDELIAILLQGTREMPGCLSHIVASDPADAATIWVTEVWEDQACHAASISLPAVREAIARGKPLIARFDQRVVTEPVGGHGLTSVAANLARHGGLSYLEIPALDAEQSAAFYGHVLGWRIERREMNDYRFEDATGHLIGRWVSPRATSREPGWLPYFYVDHIDDAVGRAVEHGGEIVKSPYPEGKLWVATVRDPTGNVLGLWQAGPRLSDRRASTREGIEPAAADHRSSRPVEVHQ
jgi:predicted enzyme related to lactoylglutathione lyase/quinol monooxygenase YgiN